MSIRECCSYDVDGTCVIQWKSQIRRPTPVSNMVSSHETTMDDNVSCLEQFYDYFQIAPETMNVHKSASAMIHTVVPLKTFFVF